MPTELKPGSQTELINYVRKSGMMLDQIAEYSNFAFKKDTVSRALRNPARTSLKSYLLMAEAVGMPQDEAETEWKESRRKFLLEREGLE